MASGKSTLGRALARSLSLSYSFVDLDAEVERIAGMSTADIFRTHGADAFRRMESEALEGLSRRHGLIVACGGGTPCFGANMDVMLASGLTVWLRANAAVTAKRINEAPAAQRPLMQDVHGSRQAVEQRITDMLALREPFYSRAHEVFDSSRLDNKLQIAESVNLFINKYIQQ